MKLSIIIPVYNAADTVCRTLDSIYSQGLDMGDFEVICVDDCSTDNTPEVLEGYAQRLGGNLCIARHAVNKRQGGARNTAIRMAKGDWLLFIDDDDFFLDGTLGKLLAFAEEHPGLDTVMFDYGEGVDVASGNFGIYTRQHLDERVMTGEEFLQRIPVPWVPWCYMYGREHLLQTGFLFEEKVRFEDTDFVLKYTARANAICFVPLEVVFHTIHPNQTTSNLGNDPERLRDMHLINYRIYDAAVKERAHSIAASKAIMGHATFARRSLLKGFTWRLSPRAAWSVLRECRYTENTGDGLVDFTNRHVGITVAALMLMKPVLSVAVRVRKRLKG